MRRALPILAVPVLAVLLAGCLIAPPPSRGSAPVPTTTSTTTSTTTTSTTVQPLASAVFAGPRGFCAPALFVQGGTQFDICQGSLENGVFVDAFHSTGEVCSDTFLEKFLLFADVDLVATQGGTTVVVGGTPDQLEGPFHRWATGLDVDDGPVTVTLRSFTLSGTTVCL